MEGEIANSFFGDMFSHGIYPFDLGLSSTFSSGSLIKSSLCIANLKILHVVNMFYIAGVYLRKLRWPKYHSLLLLLLGRKTPKNKQTSTGHLK